MWGMMILKEALDKSCANDRPTIQAATQTTKYFTVRKNVYLPGERAWLPVPGRWWAGGRKLNYNFRFLLHGCASLWIWLKFSWHISEIISSPYKRPSLDYNSPEKCWTTKSILFNKSTSYHSIHWKYRDKGGGGWWTHGANEWKLEEWS